MKCSEFAILKVDTVKDGDELIFVQLQVTVVGVIRGVAPFVTYTLYSVDDMTGPPLKVKLWMNSEVGSTDSRSTHCNTASPYVCCIISSPWY